MSKNTKRGKSSTTTNDQNTSLENKPYGYWAKKAREAGLDVSIVQKRIDRGWTEEEALTIPKNKLRGKRKFAGRPTVQKIVERVRENLPSSYSVEVVPYLEKFSQIRVWNEKGHLVSFAGFFDRNELDGFLWKEIVSEALYGDSFSNG